MKNLLKIGMLAFAFIFISVDTVSAQSWERRREARREYRDEIRDARRDFRRDIRRGKSYREARRDFREERRDARRDYRRSTGNRYYNRNRVYIPNGRYQRRY